MKRFEKMTDQELIDFCHIYMCDIKVCEALKCEELCKEEDCPIVQCLNRFEQCIKGGEQK